MDDNCNVIMIINICFLLDFCSDYLDEMSVDEPQCEPYRGSVCSPHIANSQVYIPAGQTQADIEAALGAAIQQINNDLPITLNQRCTSTSSHPCAWQPSHSAENALAWPFIGCAMMSVVC